MSQTDHLPHDIYDKVAVSYFPYHFLLWICAFISLLLALFFLRKFFLKKKTPQTPIPLSLEERLVSLVPCEPFGEYVFQLGLLVREYLKAKESTTQELIARQRLHQNLPQELLDFLIYSDGVKFAHLPTTYDQVSSWYEIIKDLIKHSSTESKPQ